MNTPKGEQTIFAEALRLPREERAAYLDQVTRGNPELRQEVESLLQGYADGEFLEQAAAPQSRPTLQITVPPSEKPGDRIGRYKLLQRIGEGGCGVVYMAEQEEPVSRRVALKIIKLGMDTNSVIARFEAERQALALMDHPSIAKVFDAGATETGRPYFVMELVRGVKITDFCDEKKLPTHERLDLFIQVCQAIQHAHQKGIIHRDLKPSNILVSVNDGKMVPKIIDFGIAKAASGQKLTDKTLFTAFEQFIGTPAYMSPEQAVITNVDIDTRSDIYALGVLLYELLTGETPFDPEELLQIGLDQMRRTIQETEPPRPSTRVSTLPVQELSTTAHRRGLEAPKLVSELRGDLDWIVMKCLEKDRARRYETANGLANDIQRHLDNEPVVACPPSRFYRFQKLVRRNKLAFAAGAAVAVALMVGLGTSTWMFFQERAMLRRAVAAEQAQTRLRQETERERERAARGEKKAQIEAAKSQQVAQFLQEMLTGVGPSVAAGRDTTILLEILNRTEGRLGKELTNQPEVEAELRNAIGSVYFELGQFSQAGLMYTRSLELLRQAFGDDHLAVADTLHKLAQLHRRLAQPNQAEASERQALAIYQKLLGRQNRKVGASLNTLGFVLSNMKKQTEAETVLREALDINRKVLGEEHPQVGISLCRLGIVLQHLDELDEAESVFREAVRIQQIAPGGVKQPGLVAPDAELGWTLSYLARVLERKGNLSEAETASYEAVALASKALRPNHPDRIDLMNRWINLNARHGSWEQAEAGLTRFLQVDPNDILSLQALANVLAPQGRWQEAADCFVSLSQSDPTNPYCYYYLAPLLVASGDLEKYRDFCQVVVARFRDTTDPTTGHHMAKICLILPDSGADPDAVAQMADTRAAGANALANPWFQFVKGLAEYRQGHFASAVEWLKKTLTKAGEPGREVPAYMVLAMAHHRLKETEEARAAFVRGAVIERTRLPKLGSGGISGDWVNWIIAHKLLEEATALIADGSNINMDQILDDLVSKSPDSRELLNLRADYRAQQGRWAEAADDYAGLIQSDPTDSLNHFRLAVLLAAGGNPEEYHDFCQVIVDRFRNTIEPLAGRRMARACLILPDFRADLDAVAQMVDTGAVVATDHWATPWFQVLKSLAECRTGRFESAVTWANKALNEYGSAAEARTIQAYTVLAMSQYRLGQTNEARKALTQATEIEQMKLPELESGDIGKGWLEWIIAHILLDEATTMIGDSPGVRAETK